MNVETGSHTGVWDWRSVLRNVARLSCMPVFPDTDCLNCFCNIGQICVLDLNARATYPCIEPPECSLETVARMPPLPSCRVAEILSDTAAQMRGCTRMRGCTVNGHSPGETHDARDAGVSPG